MIGIIHSLPQSYKLRSEEQKKIEYMKSLTDKETFEFLKKYEETDLFHSSELPKEDIEAAKNQFRKMNPSALLESYPEVAPFTSEITFAIICGRKFHIERWGCWVYLVLEFDNGRDFLVSLKKLKRER